MIRSKLWNNDKIKIKKHKLKGNLNAINKAAKNSFKFHRIKDIPDHGKRLPGPRKVDPQEVFYFPPTTHRRPMEASSDSPPSRGYMNTIHPHIHSDTRIVCYADDITI
ncbi:hypothetical protein CDAR_518791 [Caerostris darwini]|uniref:Reverse transcriptase domain-containing protein n=1 Tax=Caerostris darwini TaxID=1538125 RepID=A0AAV4PS71_9ARAC|nr:hypothetical protein CDAR_518791 [Caerostris darwini]